jgi:hypothetical protein
MRTHWAITRLAAGLAAVLIVAGCTEQEKANDTDRQRIEQMETEPVVAGQAGSAKEGAGDGGDFSANSYTAYPVAKVAASSPKAARDKAAEILAQLRSQGWTVISARCADPSAGSYTWEAFSYKMRDKVPFAAHLIGSYSRESGLTVSLAQQAPFHADTKERFRPAPAALTQTCVEHGDVEHPDAAQGSTWSL